MWSVLDVTDYFNIDDIIKYEDYYYMELEDETSVSKFKVLLPELVSHVKNTESRKNVYQQLQLTKEMLEVQKQHFFQQQLFCFSLYEAQENFEFNNAKSLSLKDINSSAAFFNCGLLCKNIPAENEETGIKFFGMTKEFVLKHISQLSDSPLKDFFLTEVEKVIYKISRNVLTWNRQESSDKMVFVRVSQLPGLLKEEKENIKSSYFQLDQDKRLFDKQIKHYSECLVRALSLMVAILDLHEQKVKHCSSVAYFYAAKCKALFLKIKILHLKILTETYTYETVPALRIIRNDLRLKTDELEKSIAEKKAILHSYSLVGDAFDSLVQEYAKLSQAIQNEKWALEEWKKSEDHVK